MKILLIGEAPPRGKLLPFEGRSGERLRELMGALWGMSFLMTLFDLPDVEANKGSAFPFPVAREKAETVRAGTVLPRFDILLLVGKRMAAAFGVRAHYFDPCLLKGVVAYVIPHPSGSNHWWNNEFNRYKARNFFGFLEELPGEEIMSVVEFKHLATKTAEEGGRLF